MEQCQNAIILTLDKPEETSLKAREATTEPQKPENILEMIPEQYHQYKVVFTKPTAGQLPPKREWDLKVRLVENTPTSISCTPYHLTKAKEEFQEKYIKENLDRGFIHILTSPYSIPIFYKPKKDGSF